MDKAIMTKAALARSLGVSRASLYYVSRLDQKDWLTKARMEEELRQHPSYGSRRLSEALHICRDQARRVMHKFGTSPIAAEAGNGGERSAFR